MWPLSDSFNFIAIAFNYEISVTLTSTMGYG